MAGVGDFAAVAPVAPSLQHHQHHGAHHHHAPSSASRNTALPALAGVNSLRSLRVQRPATRMKGPITSQERFALQSERAARKRAVSASANRRSSLLNSPMAEAALANLGLNLHPRPASPSKALTMVGLPQPQHAYPSATADEIASFRRSRTSTRMSGHGIGGGGGIEMMPSVSPSPPATADIVASSDDEQERPHSPPLPHIPLEINAGDDGSVRITALNLLPLSPLVGVRHVQHPSQTEADFAALHPRRPSRGGLLHQLAQCLCSSRVPMDTYVRCSLLPSGIGQQTEVVPNSGTNVTWRLPQRLKLYFDPDSAVVAGQGMGGGGGGNDSMLQMHQGAEDLLTGSPAVDEQEERDHEHEQNEHASMVSQHHGGEENTTRPSSPSRRDDADKMGDGSAQTQGADILVADGVASVSSVPPFGGYTQQPHVHQQGEPLSATPATTDQDFAVSSHSLRAIEEVPSVASSPLITAQRLPPGVASGSRGPGDDAEQLLDASIPMLRMPTAWDGQSPLPSMPPPPPSSPPAIPAPPHAADASSTPAAAPAVAASASGNSDIARIGEGPSSPSAARRTIVLTSRPSHQLSVTPAGKRVFTLQRRASQATNNQEDAAAIATPTAAAFSTTAASAASAPAAATASTHESALAAPSGDAAAASSTAATTAAPGVTRSVSFARAPTISRVPTFSRRASRPLQQSQQADQPDASPSAPSRQFHHHHKVSFAGDDQSSSSSSDEDGEGNGQGEEARHGDDNETTTPSALSRRLSVGRQRSNKLKFARTASHMAARAKPLLLVEVICCAPGSGDYEDDYLRSGESSDSSTPFSGRTEGDRLVSSATLDLESFLLSAGKPGRASLDLTDVETLDEQGQVNLVVEWRPNPLGIDTATTGTDAHVLSGGATTATGDDITSRSTASVLSNAPGAKPLQLAKDGYFHVEVVAIIGLRDPFNEMAFTSALADWTLMGKMFVAVLLYLAAGVIYYVHAEGWTMLEAIYFCVVTATTTGYGDLRPSSTESRVFTLFFIVVGISLIAIAVGIAGGLMLERQEQEMYRAMMAEKTRAAAGKDAAANTQGNAAGVPKWLSWLGLGHTGKRVLGSFLFFSVVLWGGAIAFLHLEPGLDFFDSLYLCVVTMSTVGYGDRAPKSEAARAFCIPWIIVSAASVTRIIGDVTNAYMTHARNARAKAVLKNSIQSVEDLAALDDDNCFSDDTRVMTDRGFLFGEEVKAVLSSGEDLKFACYDVATKQLVFAPCVGNRLSADGTAAELISFTGAKDAARWTSTTDGITRECDGDDDEAAGVSMLVTRQHRMFTQWGMQAAPAVSADNADAGPHKEYGVQAAEFFLPRDSATGAHAADTTPPSSESTAVRFLAHAAAGVQRNKEERSAFLRFCSEQLGITACAHCFDGSPHPAVVSDAEHASPSCAVLAFIEQYGFRLGAGTAGGAESASCPELSAVLAAHVLDAVATAGRFADWVLTLLTAEQLRWLIRGYQRSQGQGSRAKGDTDRPQRLYTDSAAFCDEWVRAILLAGYSARALLLAKCGAVSCSGTVTPSDHWAIDFSDAASDSSTVSTATHPILSSSRDVHVEPYAGRVWCVTVEHPDHLLVAQRALRDKAGAVTHQSRPIIIGNSGEVSELEFLKHLLVKTQACKQRDIDVICEQFRALDVDGSGFLNADDFKKMAERKQQLRMGAQAVQAIL